MIALSSLPLYLQALSTGPVMPVFHSEWALTDELWLQIW